VTAYDWDDLSLTMHYNASASAAAPGPSLRLPIVKGSPFITAEVPAPARPVVRAPGGGGATLLSMTQPAANKLRLVVGNVPADGTHTWLLWASKPIAYTLASGSITIAGVDSGAAGTFTGVLRLAWVPNAGAAGAATSEAMLDQYSDAYPVGGAVNAWSNPAAGTASYSLSWATRSMSGNASSDALLILALPHHVDTLTAPSSTAAGRFPLGVVAPGAGTATGGATAYYTSSPAASSGRTAQDYGAYVMGVRGPQVPVVGSCWLLQHALPSSLGDEAAAAANLRDPAWRADIEKTLLVSRPRRCCAAMRGATVLVSSHAMASREPCVLTPPLAHACRSTCTCRPTCHWCCPLPRCHQTTPLLTGQPERAHGPGERTHAQSWPRHPQHSGLPLLTLVR
jgi:hypothetical protein